MMFHRIVSALLEYPDEGLREAFPEIEQAIAGADDVTPEERAALLGFLKAVAEVAALDPLAVETEYVRTFDMVPEHSLHLTHHLIGEDRDRGPALIDLGDFYRSHGLDVSVKELPDYLPLMLEFLGLLDEDEAAMFLSRWAKVIRQLRVNLEHASSRYADVVRLIERRSTPATAPDDSPEPNAAETTDPCLEDGDLDPEVVFTAPAAFDAPCTR